MDNTELLAYIDRTLESTNQKFNETNNTPDDSRKVTKHIEVIAELMEALHQTRCHMEVPATKKSPATRSRGNKPSGSLQGV